MKPWKGNITKIKIAFLIVIIPLFYGFSPQRVSTNQKKIEREQIKKKKQEQKKYESAIKRHKKMQTKETQARMKQTKKASRKATPIRP